jgi:hypothetical protein
METMEDEVTHQTKQTKERPQSLDDLPLIHVLSQLNGDLKNIVPDPEKRGRVKAFLETIRSQKSSSSPDQKLITECQRKIEQIIQ